MQNSDLASLSTALPGPAIQSLAGQFGASERTVRDGILASIATVISGLSQRSGDSGFLNQVLHMASAAPQDSVASALSNGSLSNPASTFLTGSAQFLSTLFGGKLSSITEMLGTQTGLRSTAVTTLLALGVQTVLGFLGNKMRDGSVNASSLPGLLAKESDAMQALLPAGLQKLFAPTGTHKVEIDPVVAQSVKPEPRRSILPWLLLLLLAALLLGFWWYRSHQQPAAVVPPETTAPPVASTVTSTSGADLGGLVNATLPDSTTLRIPERGVEGKLLAFIKDPAKTPDKTSWFDFDRLLFDTGSATLQPQSAEQLSNIAAILKAYPAVHLTIGGYTDNTGNAAQNLKLSQDRADSVVDQLEKMGVARDRLAAKGYGDEHPVGDNSTEEGRALNRRISMLVTAK